MTQRTAELNRSTVHDMSPLPSARDRGRQSFIFHAKRRLGQFAWLQLQAEFDRAGQEATPPQLANGAEAAYLSGNSFTRASLPLHRDESIHLLALGASSVFS